VIDLPTTTGSNFSYHPPTGKVRLNGGLSPFSKVFSQTGSPAASRSPLTAHRSPLTAYRSPLKARSHLRKSLLNEMLVKSKGTVNA